MKGCDASGFDNGIDQSGYHYGQAGNRAFLIHYAERLGFGAYIPEFFRKNALVISDWEASSRYDIHFSIKITSLEKCYREIMEWYDKLNDAGIK